MGIIKQDLFLSHELAVGALWGRKAWEPLICKIPRISLFGHEVLFTILTSITSMGAKQKLVQYMLGSNIVLPSFFPMLWQSLMIQQPPMNLILPQLQLHRHQHSLGPHCDFPGWRFFNSGPQQNSEIQEWIQLTRHELCEQAPICYLTQCEYILSTTNHQVHNINQQMVELFDVRSGPYVTLEVVSWKQQKKYFFFKRGATFSYEDL